MLQPLAPWLPQAQLSIAQVWRATLDGTLPVAVKMLSSKTLDAGALKAFLNEVQVS